MKKININKLCKNAKDKVAILGNVLGPIGNNNIRGGHISYYEKKIIENNENQKNELPVCPYYFAWITIYAEYVFWEIRQFCYHQNDLKTPECYNHDYNKLLRFFFHKCKDMECYTESEALDIFDHLVSILIIRHSHTHGGFPNLFPATLEHLDNIQKPTINKNIVEKNYSIEEVKSRIEFASNPENFEKIKDEFVKIQNFLGKARPYSIGI